jgi:hypothetical protein
LRRTRDNQEENKEHDSDYVKGQEKLVQSCNNFI